MILRTGTLNFYMLDFRGVLQEGREDSGSRLSERHDLPLGLDSVLQALGDTAS